MTDVNKPKTLTEKDIKTQLRVIDGNLDYHKKMYYLKEKRLSILDNLLIEFKKNPRPIELKYEYEKFDSYWEVVKELKDMETQEQKEAIKMDLLKIKDQIETMENQKANLLKMIEGDKNE